ncbi:MAG: fatty acid desaturase, partial [Rhodobacteraceae bacterium]|nr:fatty acid desaturase [Paracoccaceae bacterium]
MNDESGIPSQEADAPPASDWTRIMAKYRQPSFGRSLWEIFVTVVPFVVLWVLAYLALSVSVWLTIGLCVLASGFLTRLFVIQHDCGHAAFFKSRVANDWLGRVIGVVTLTPY